MGTAAEDQTLIADTSGISDNDGTGTFLYQWIRNGSAIPGATNSTLTLGDQDVGSTIVLQVSYMDNQGTSEGPLISSPVGPIANVNDPPNGIPIITGTAAEDQTLTASTNGISDDDGLGVFNYQWLRDGVAITGATNIDYTLGDPDVGSSIVVQVSYVDSQGTAEGPLSSVPVGPVANINDVPNGIPVINGIAAEDQTLTASTSGISDDDGVGVFAYQWLRDGVAITGATNSTYTLDDADVGSNITLQVSYTDNQGTAEGPLQSAVAGPVTNVNDASNGSPIVVGIPREHIHLSVDQGRGTCIGCSR